MTHLSQSQNAVISAITNYGLNHNFDDSQIQTVRDIAFAETSLGLFSNSTHVGLFQYSPSTWAQVYPGLNINSQNDQIEAMFSEVATYGPQFIALVNSGNSMYANYTAAEYVDAVHHYHLGNPHPNVTQSELDSAHKEISAAKSALGIFGTRTQGFLSDEEQGTGSGAYSFDNNFGWINFPETQPTPKAIITVGPTTYTDSFGDTWNLS